MPSFSPDTSCMVPALIPEHPHHERAVAAINGRLDAGDTMVIVAHTLLETYSTLTRLPVPSRVGPHDALAGIQEAFLTQGIVVALRHEQHVQLVCRLVDDACAREAGVVELLPFNERHFRRFEGNGLKVTVP